MLSVLSTALCLLYSSLPLYDYLPPLGPSVLSTALCLLYSPLSPLQPSVPSGKQRNKQNNPIVSLNVFQNAFCQNSKGYRDLFRISDNHGYRYNHDYHSSEILGRKSCDNCNNHIQQEAIIIFREKMKTPFRINPTCSAVDTNYTD
jgi:hypothetical protein